MIRQRFILNSKISQAEVKVEREADVEKHIGLLKETLINVEQQHNRSSPLIAFILHSNYIIIRLGKSMTGII